MTDEAINDDDIGPAEMDALMAQAFEAPTVAETRIVEAPPKGPATLYAHQGCAEKAGGGTIADPRDVKVEWFVRKPYKRDSPNFVDGVGGTRPPRVTDGG